MTDWLMRVQCVFDGLLGQNERGSEREYFQFILILAERKQEFCSVFSDSCWLHEQAVVRLQHIFLSAYTGPPH